MQTHRVQVLRREAGRFKTNSFRGVAVEKKVRVPPPQSDLGAGGPFDFSDFLGVQVSNKNKMPVHGFWGVEPIFFGT